MKQRTPSGGPPPTIAAPNTISNPQLAAMAANQKALFNNYRSSPYKPVTLELQLDTVTTDGVRIYPRGGQSNIYIWNNNQVSEIDMSNFPNGREVPMTGNMLDIAAIAANSRYLIWAIFNTDGSFARFGFTLKPFLVYTAVSSGSQGSLATYTTAGTGANNCYSFQPSQVVTVRNEDAGTGAPNYQWNFGTVTAINSATSISILMWDGVPNATNITSTTTAQIQAWDNFKCWDGSSAEITAYTNAKVIGELITNSSMVPFWVRSVGSIYHYNPLSYPTITRNSAGTTTTTYQLYRWLPPWANICHMRMALQTSATSAIGRCETFYGSTAAANGLAFLSMHTSANIASNFLRQEQWIPLTWGSVYTDTNVMVSGAGTISTVTTILGYNDGGLRD
jgi:hypothetical protein